MNDVIVSKFYECWRVLVVCQCPTFKHVITLCYVIVLKFYQCRPFQSCMCPTLTHAITLNYVIVSKIYQRQCICVVSLLHSWLIFREGLVCFFYEWMLVSFSNGHYKLFCLLPTTFAKSQYDYLSILAHTQDNKSSVFNVGIYNIILDLAPNWFWNWTLQKS
jgi:hypothetical protein